MLMIHMKCKNLTFLRFAESNNANILFWSSGYKLVLIAAEITYSRCCCGLGAGAPGESWKEEQKRAGCGTVAGPAGWIRWTQPWELLYHSAGCGSASQTPAWWSLWSSLCTKEQWMRWVCACVASSYETACAMDTCFGMSSMLFLSRKSCMRPVGTPAGIFFRLLRARLSCMRLPRSLNVFLPRSLSLSWKRSHHTLLYPKQHSVVRWSSIVLFNRGLPDCCRGQAESGSPSCWRNRQES